MNKKFLALGIFLIAAGSVLMIATAQINTHLEYYLTLKLNDSFVVGGERFRLIEINPAAQYFLLNHELGDNLHIIPLEIPLEAGFGFALEGVDFQVSGFDESHIVLKAFI